MNKTQPLIRVETIRKTYRLGEIEVRALAGVSLEVEDCDFLVVTGRNGSGKSTLLYQIGLLDRPDSGAIYFEGREVVGLPDRSRRDLRLGFLGYIFQNFALIAELTAIENVMLPAMMLDKTADCKKRAAELLKQVGLANRMDHLPRQLSGGEQQKVAIARALINRPRVIIADEPTSNLDSIAAKEIIGIFQMINRDHGHAIVMVTHEQDETSVATRILKLSDGAVAS